MTIGTIFCNQCGSQNSSAAQFCSNCGATLANALPASNRMAVPDPTLAAPPQAQYSQGIGPAQNAIPTVYGGFWIRFVAAVIDGIVVQAVVVPVAFIVGLVIGVAGAAVSGMGRGPNIAAIVIAGVFGLFASWLYEAAMESSSKQATLGKMVLSLKERIYRATASPSPRRPPGISASIFLA
jgi:RDD family/zinc-ribbon domain